MVMFRYIMKAITVMLLCITGLHAVPYFPVTGMTATRHEVVSCLADELSQQGYQLNTHGTEFLGIGWVYSICEGGLSRLSGELWIRTLVTGGPEREVGVYGANREGNAVFKEVLRECAERFTGGGLILPTNSGHGTK
ncbi:hypothetical protein ETH90_25250 [Salmonella enterica]|nr:hypothetical protein [Salmonella enterica]EBE2443112.1 hypothetical protein [Salmonella enterica subsp. enterica serovar Infantis]EBQ9782926.1 hypothetical protein [Salmonella enterica subsp. enterica serovar Inganda]ECH8971147.1 hypothetical protein [Salmonella enterica subsp. enterica]MLT77932.1 hypothetical protein [Salmonella enterica subsp. enterica serovar Sandiego]